jgi:hypothetical protein
VNEELLRRSYERLLVIREHEGPDREHCPSLEDIHDLVTRTGDEASRLKRLDHVMQCLECRKEFDLLRSVELSRPRAQASSWRLWALAATVVLVAGATVVWRMMLPREDVLRGSSERLTLVAPVQGAAVQLPATLTWRSVPGALSYRVELRDETGRVSYSSAVTDTTLTLESVPEAVVSWKVVAEFLSAIPLESPTRTIQLEPQR